MKKISEASKTGSLVDNSALMRDMLLIAENEAEREMKYLATSLTHASACLGVSLGRKRSRVEKVSKNIEETKALKEQLGLEEMRIIWLIQQTLK